jgi:hypothetical protein
MSRGELRAARWVAPRRHRLTKVPEVTAYFWITKVLTTGMGEATSAVSGKDVMVRSTGPRTPARPDAGPGVAAAARPLQSGRHRRPD